jgi:formate dehydrogenase major subunit
VPLETEITGTTCPYCSTGCSIDIETYGNMLIKANPDREGAVNKGLLCGRGKFGVDTSLLHGKLLAPLIRNVDGFSVSDYHEAVMLTAKKAQSVAAKYGKDAVAVAISDRYTNEEAYIMKSLADAIGAKALCFNHRASGLKPVLGFDASPNTIDELISTDLILAIGFDSASAPLLRLKIKQAAESCAKVILINPEGCEQEHFDFAKQYCVKNDTSFLKGVAKALLDMGKASDIEGFDEFVKSVSKAAVTDDMKSVAEAYAKAKKAMIVFEQNFVTTEAASLIADIALLSGHIGAPRDGILQLKPKNNSQGLIDIGVTDGAEAAEEVKALLIFGENPDVDLSGIEFTMVCDTHLTDAAKRADVVFPGTGSLCVGGTYTNTERRVQETAAVIDEGVDITDMGVAAEIAHVYEVDLPYGYMDGETGEIADGVLTPESPAFVAACDGLFTRRLVCTDNLMNVSAGAFQSSL